MQTLDEMVADICGTPHVLVCLFVCLFFHPFLFNFFFSVRGTRRGERDWKVAVREAGEDYGIMNHLVCEKVLTKDTTYPKEFLRFGSEKLPNIFVILQTKDWYSCRFVDVAVVDYLVHLHRF